MHLESTRHDSWCLRCMYMSQKLAWSAVTDCPPVITVKQLARLQGGLDLNLLCLNVSCVPGAGFRDAMQSKRQRLDMNGTEPGENGRAPSAE